MSAAHTHHDPPDRLVLTSLDERGGNIAATWRDLSALGWRVASLSTFRRRVDQIVAVHPTAPLSPIRGKPVVRFARSNDRSSPQKPTGDVLVVAIDVEQRDVIRSWLIPNSRGSAIETKIREGLALRSHLMLDLSEFASHRRDTR